MDQARGAENLCRSCCRSAVRQTDPGGRATADQRDPALIEAERKEGKPNGVAEREPVSTRRRSHCRYPKMHPFEVFSGTYFPSARSRTDDER
jgi:hypothetical protein